ncbi:hypothetical protein MKX03_020961 [Papaver bracteatum]|nr:hypothetical protein MKX03_020961 [Papaver bracteatum]
MFIGFGVGMASMTSPLYISEFSPPKLRDFLVSLNFILYGIGKFLFLHLYNVSDSSLSSNYIIALIGIAGLSHFYLMLKFPESPMWLYKKDRKEEAIKVLKNYYACFQVDKESDAFKLLMRSETTYEDGISYSSSSIFSKIRSAWCNPPVRKQFVVGTTLHVVQQLVGLNSLIFFTPSIHKLTGFGPSNPKDDIEFMKTSLYINFGVFSIFGGICCTFCLVERFGKKKILCWSTYCVLAGLLGLCFIFILSPTTGVVNRFESTIHFRNNTCSSYLAAPNADSWDCLTCLRASSGCGFCGGIHKNILGQSSGACLIAESNGKSQACSDENRFWSTESCENSVFALPVVFIFSFLIFSGNLEIIPWIMNSQMYPTEVRGVYGGTAAAANWTFFLIAIIFSFVLTKTQGPVFTCLLISMLSFFVSLFIKSFVPENIGS